MADKAHRLTDEKLEEMEKRLSAIYSRAEKEIGVRWKEYLAESQSEIDGLQKEYELAKKIGDAKEIRKAGKKLSKAKRERTLMDKRFKDLTETTAKQFANVNKTALAYVNGQLPEVYSINYNALEKSVDGVGGYSFSLVDADTVKNLATTDKSLLPYKKLDEKKDVRWNVKKMNAEVLQGILQGEPMDKIASRLSKVTDMNATAAIRNARTMVTGAENKGRQDSYARATADGIILAKEWISTNDSRTRHSHAALDGATVDQDKKFDNGLMFPGDPNGRPEEVYNCRCTVAAVVKGFKKAQVQKAMAEKKKEIEPVRKKTETVTQSEWDVLEDYVSGEGMDINNFLRQRNGLSISDMTESEKKRLSLMDSAMKKSELSKRRVLYRSVDASAVFNQDSLRKIRWDEYTDDDLQGFVGKTITDKGFMSTTTDKEIAFGWGDFTGSESPIVIEFDVPSGTHGIDLRKFDVEGKEQKEILLDRGLSYEITKIETDKMRFDDEFGEYYETSIVVKARIKKK